MGKKLYVGNLSYNVRDDDLQQVFAQYGTVPSAQVIMDRDTGRSKGFGFVEMGTDPEAQAAINGMNGQDLDGRAIVVNEARPREERPGGSAAAAAAAGGGGGTAAVAAATAAAVAATAAAAAATAAVVAATAAAAVAATAVAAATAAAAAAARRRWRRRPRRLLSRVAAVKPTGKAVQRGAPPFSSALCAFRWRGLRGRPGEHAVVQRIRQRAHQLRTIAHLPRDHAVADAGGDRLVGPVGEGVGHIRNGML